MAITATLLRITLRYVLMGQKCETQQYYEPVGAAFLTATPVGVGEAWWNDVKAAWRGLAVSGAPSSFDTVVVEEIGGGLAFGEFAVPTAEKGGTRAYASSGDYLPSYCAVGCRLTVGTRSTRPGQKRFPFVGESDTGDNVVSATYLALAATLAEKYSSTITLGAPVATGTLRPKVVRWSKTVPPTVVASQDVTGFLLNPYITSQVSRRRGNGS